MRRLMHNLYVSNRRIISVIILSLLVSLLGLIILLFWSSREKETKDDGNSVAAESSISMQTNEIDDDSNFNQTPKIEQKIEHAVDYPWYLIIILVVSAVANISIAFLIFFYNRKRIKLLTDKKYVEPEKLQRTMQDLSENTGALDKQLSELKQHNDHTVQGVIQQTTSALSKLEENDHKHGEKIQEIMNAFLELNTKLDEKDEEIKRYKEGHDSKLINKYILSYIKIRDQIIKMTDSDQFVLKNLEQLIERLNMEIEHADVKEIEVSIGDKFLDEKYGGKLATPKLVPTDDTGKNGTIVSVDLAGYEFTGNERNIILRPAKVSVYELQEIK